MIMQYKHNSSPSAKDTNVPTTRERSETMEQEKKKSPDTENGAENKTVLAIVAIQLVLFIAALVLLAVRKHEAFQDCLLLFAVLGTIRKP